jgi:WD40 repeat protein
MDMCRVLLYLQIIIIVSGSYDRTIRLWDRESGIQLRVLKGHMDHVMSVAISKNNKLIISAGRDLTIKVWELGNGL